MAKEIKLSDIAERAGVSVATVSMVLSGKGKISSLMSDKVIAIAEQLNYRRPGVVIDRRLDFRYVTILHSESDRFSWTFSYDLITGLEILLVEKGYYPLVIHMNDRWQAETIVAEIRANRSGAIFAVDYTDVRVVPKLERLEVPLIVVNNGSFQDRFSSVLADDIQGACEGASHLIAAGHRSIAYAEYERPKMPLVVNERRHGFRKAMDEAGLPVTEDLYIISRLEEPEELEKKIAALFKGPGRPTAILAHDDYCAACIIGSLGRLGLSVPRDVSIVAPGDVLDYSQPFLPRISTMRIDTELMTRMAVEIMLESITRQKREALVIKTKLRYMDRGSIRKIR